MLAIGAYGGIVVTIAPYGLYTLALRRLPASEASIVATLEPAVAVVLAGALLGERLAPLQLLGALGILGGVVLLALPSGATDARPRIHSLPAAISVLIAWWHHRLTVRLS